MKLQRSIPLLLLLASCSGPKTEGRDPAGLAHRDESAAAPGPAAGETLPPFEATDQDGRVRSFESLRGPKGLLLNFNRSVVW